MVATVGAAITVGATMTAAPAVAATTKALGIQVFAIGAVAFDVEVVAFAPFYSVELEPIEWAP